MKKIWPRILLCAAVLVLVGAAAFYWFSRPEQRTVELDVPGMLLFADGREPVPCRVQMDGTYTHTRVGNDGDSFDPGYGGLTVDGREIDSYLFYCYFPPNGSGYSNGVSESSMDLHYIANQELDLFLHELGYDGQGRVFYPRSDGLAADESVCLLAFPAEDVDAARALMDRALAQPRDNLDWLSAYYSEAVHSGW